MKKLYTLLSISLIALATSVTSVTSVMADGVKIQMVFEAICAPRDELVKQLKTAHDETHKVLGLTNNNMIFELFQTKDGGTWTAVINRPDGISCMVFSGEDLEILIDVIKKKGSKI